MICRWTDGRRAMKRLIKIMLAAFSIFGAIFLTDITVHAETPNSSEDFGYYDYDYDKV